MSFKPNISGPLNSLSESGELSVCSLPLLTQRMKERGMICLVIIRCSRISDPLLEFVVVVFVLFLPILFSPAVFVSQERVLIEQLGSLGAAHVAAAFLTTVCLPF